MTQTIKTIVNARVQGVEQLQSIAISDGRFTRISTQAGRVEPGADELDASGNLVVPPFVEPHITTRRRWRIWNGPINWCPASGCLATGTRLRCSSWTRRTKPGK